MGLINTIGSRNQSTDLKNDPKLKDLNQDYIGINITQLTKLQEAGKTNILLIGLPGAGKTTVGKLLAAKLNAEVYDVDDHHLESVWGCPVADKL